MLRKGLGFCMLLLLLLLVPSVCAAAHITEDDCAIGGVKAGWHSQHHYLPDAFNNTALKNVSWKKTNGYIAYTLDVRPNGPLMDTMMCARVSPDQSLDLRGVYMRRSSGNNNIYTALFKKDWLYIYGIKINFTPEIDHSYKVVATDMATPRGIKLGDTLDDVYHAYGQEDGISDEDGVEWYWYVTEKSWKVEQSNPYYVGARLGFLIYDNTVMSIVAINTYDSER